MGGLVRRLSPLHVRARARVSTVRACVYRVRVCRPLVPDIIDRGGTRPFRLSPGSGPAPCALGERFKSRATAAAAAMQVERAATSSGGGWRWRLLRRRWRRRRGVGRERVFRRRLIVSDDRLPSGRGARRRRPDGRRGRSDFVMRARRRVTCEGPHAARPSVRGRRDGAIRSCGRFAFFFLSARARTRVSADRPVPTR